VTGRQLIGVRTAALVLALLGLTGCASQAPAPARQVAAEAYHGVEPEPVPARPSFALTATDGRRYDFAAETHGHPTYLYFGYTHCPDECPTAMADLATALRRQPPPLRDSARVVFVTTDAARDTGPVVRRWLGQFSSSFVGLTGTQAELDAAQRAAGLSPASRAGPIPTLSGNPAAHPSEAGAAPHKHVGRLGYAVAHQNVILAYDVSDRLPVLYPGGSTPADIAADLPALARQKDRP